MELGHTKVQLDGALCRCGQRGCLEAYVADYALAREATTALNWIHKDGQPVQVLLESLYDHAKAGNPAARSIFRRAGRYLAVGLANVVNLFDPALIILSGERMRYDYLYAADSLAEMESLVLNTGRRPPPIEVHAWGDMLWAQGAAALALSVVTETGWPSSGTSPRNEDRRASRPRRRRARGRRAPPSSTAAAACPWSTSMTAAGNTSWAAASR
jgi:predicted NBD/HSP70 family sugar kinase